MQNHGCPSPVPSISAEQAIALAENMNSINTLKEAHKLFMELIGTLDPDLEGSYFFFFICRLAAFWNAGRVQGIREERARRKHREQTIEQ